MGKKQAKKDSVGGILATIDHIDKSVSAPFHNMTLGPSEIFVLPFALLFNPAGVVAITILFSLNLIHFERELDTANKENVTRTEQFYVGVYYVINVLILLLCSTFAKRIGMRKRPDNPREKNPQASNCRWLDLRSHETNKSMPSGDAAQSGLLCVYLSVAFPHFYAMMGAFAFSWKLVVMVSMARVLYHCHYWGDTIVGVSIGCAVVYATSAANLGQLVAMPIAELIVSLF